MNSYIQIKVYFITLANTSTWKIKGRTVAHIYCLHYMLTHLVVMHIFFSYVICSVNKQCLDHLWIPELFSNA